MLISNLCNKKHIDTGRWKRRMDGMRGREGRKMNERKKKERLKSVNVCAVGDSEAEKGRSNRRDVFEVFEEKYLRSI